MPSSPLIKTSLSYLYQNFRNASPLSLYGVDKTFFVMDQSINECRSFLTTIVHNPSSDEETIELALKMLLVIGVMRGSVEDLISGLNLIEKQNLSKIDISEELDRISFDIEETALNPKLFQEIEKIKSDGILFYMQNSFEKENKNLRFNFGYCTDGNYLYIHYKN